VWSETTPPPLHARPNHGESRKAKELGDTEGYFTLNETRASRSAKSERTLVEILSQE